MRFACALAPSSSAGSTGMSPLLPHSSTYSGRSQSSQQSVTASGRLQLILLEGFHQSPLPKLLRGSPVTSQIPRCNRLQGQTLQPWDTHSRLSRQQKQPPKAQALCCISGSMISCCIFRRAPASFSKWVVAHCFPSPPHSSWAASGCVVRRLVSLQMLLESREAQGSVDTSLHSPSSPKQI